MAEGSMLQLLSVSNSHTGCMVLTSPACLVLAVYRHVLRKSRIYILYIAIARAVHQQRHQIVVRIHCVTNARRRRGHKDCGCDCGNRWEPEQQPSGWLMTHGLWFMI